MRTRTWLTSVVGLLLFVSPSLAVDPPSLISYQGLLCDASGTPLDGSFNMTFRLYDTPTDGNLIIEDRHLEGGTGTVTVSKGVFSILLGSGVLDDPTGVFGSLAEVVREHANLYVETAVGRPGVAMVTLAPRVRLVSVAYALRAASVPADSITDGDMVLTTGSITLTAGAFAGDGSGLTGVVASGLAAGSYSNTYVFSSISNTFIGDGANLVNLDAGSLSAGALPGARLAGTYSSAIVITNPANVIGGNGSDLGDLNADHLTLGTVPDARLAGTYSGALTLSNPLNSFAGDGSGLTGIISVASNADTLDSLDSLQFLRRDTADTAAGALSFTAAPTGTVAGAGPIYVNPATAGVNETLLGVAVAGVQKVRIDAEGDLSVAGDLSVTGTLSGNGSELTSLAASNLTGALPTLDGSDLTDLNADSLSAGTVPDARLSGTYSEAVTFSNLLNSFVGDGSGLTGIVATASNADTLDGLDSSQFLRSDTADTAAGALSLTAAPTGTVVGAGPLYVNPATAGTNETLLGVAVAGMQKVRIDAEGDLSVAGDLTVTGILSGNGSQLTSLAASNLTGALPALDGSDLTDLNADSLSAGTVPDARLSGTYSGALTFSNLLNSFTGDGSGLTGVVASGLAEGSYSNTYVFSSVSNSFTGDGSALTDLNASAVASGSLLDTRLSSNVTLAGNVFNGISQLVQLDGAGDLPALDGSALTNLNASAVAIGSLSDARLSTNVTLAGNVFNGISQLVQLDGAGALPALDGSGLTNLNADTLDGLGSAQFLRSDTNDAFVAGTLTLDPGTILDVNGDLQLNARLLMDHVGPDRDQFIYFYESGSSTGEALRWDNDKGRFEFSDALALLGPIAVGSPVAPDPQQYNQLGNSTAEPDSGAMDSDADLFVREDIEIDDTLYLSSSLFMNGNQNGGDDGDQTIYFYNQGNRDMNFFRWDEDAPSYLKACGIDSAFITHVAGGNAGWSWDSGNDSKMHLDGSGNLHTDGSQTAYSGCDLAETFVGPEGLESGTLVVLDPSTPEGILPASRPYDATTVGVVSRYAGMLLAGPTTDFLPHAEQMNALVEALKADPKDAALTAALDDLEEMRRAWTRGNVPVALVGRVMVKVDGSFGPIVQGDRLTSCPTPGHAMVLDRAGPYFGIALGDFQGTTGEILVLLQNGWYGGAGGSDAAEPETAGESGPRQSATVNQVPFSLFSGADRGLGEELLRVDARGDLYIKGALRAASMDLAECFVLSEPAEAGDVLVAHRDAPGRYGLGRVTADPAVIGVVSGEPGVLLGSGVQRISAADPGLAAKIEQARSAGDTAEELRLWQMLETRFQQTHAPVALSGTVLCKADARYGAISVGDTLTTCPTPGHAMRAAGDTPGTIIGKALEPLDAGTGLIRMLVMMR